jgi:hypothetical protein
MNMKKPLPKNLDDMGLAYDVNRTLGLPNTKKERLNFVKKLVNDELDVDEVEDPKPSRKRPKLHVMSTLEEDANAPRVSKFRLPKGQVKFISFMIDKYGLSYKKMAKDAKNYDQLTWRQMRAKCRKFMSIPEQFSIYLEERDLVDTEIDKDDPKWMETNTDMEDED